MYEDAQKLSKMLDLVHLMHDSEQLKMYADIGAEKARILKENASDEELYNYIVHLLLLDPNPTSTGTFAKLAQSKGLVDTMSALTAPLSSSISSIGSSAVTVAATAANALKKATCWTTGLGCGEIIDPVQRYKENSAWALGHLPPKYRENPFLEQTEIIDDEGSTETEKQAAWNSLKELRAKCLSQNWLERTVMEELDIIIVSYIIRDKGGKNTRELKKHIDDWVESINTPGEVEQLLKRITDIRKAATGQ